VKDVAPLFVTVYLDGGCPHIPEKVLRDHGGSRWCRRCHTYLPYRLLGTVHIAVSETGELTAGVRPAGHPGEGCEQ